MSLSRATRIPFSVLLAEEEATLLTYAEQLDGEAEAAEEARRGR